MILVTVGTSTPSFIRLLKAMEIIAPYLDQPILVQAGKTQFCSNLMDVFDFIEEKRFLHLINRSAVVVTHGGFGILSTLIDLGKKIVAVPRIKRYRESTNPQIELVRYLEGQGAIIGVYTVADLYLAIRRAETFRPRFSFEMQRIPHIVKQQIDSYRIKKRR